MEGGGVKSKERRRARGKRPGNQAGLRKKGGGRKECKINHLRALGGETSPGKGERERRPRKKKGWSSKKSNKNRRLARGKDLSSLSCPHTLWGKISTNSSRIKKRPAKKPSGKEVCKRYFCFKEKRGDLGVCSKPYPGRAGFV